MASGAGRVEKGGPHAVGKCGKGWEVDAEVATAKHGGVDAGHDGLRLDVQVAVDFVRAPPRAAQ